jgi:hypothetical protein
MRSIAYVSSLLAAGVSAFCETPEQRALSYLTREVPRWAVENKCYSCHNNGDGARALYAARRLGHSISNDAIAGTTRWLLDPEAWEKNRGDAAVSDKKLARIQFAASLAEAYEAGVIRDKAALIKAAELLVNDQSADGSWQIEGGSDIGSPATYGAMLATVMSRRTLEKAAQDRFSAAIKRATEWLSRSEPDNLLETAAILIALPGRAHALLDRIARAQTPGGGWGPQLHAPAEPFDTAIVLLALRGLNDHIPTREMIRRGRTYLTRSQQESGGWPETTRPAGSQSYAQHISTSAWATLALLQTETERQ